MELMALPELVGRVDRGKRAISVSIGDGGRGTVVRIAHEGTSADGQGKPVYPVRRFIDINEDDLLEVVQHLWAAGQQIGVIG